MDSPHALAHPGLPWLAGHQDTDLGSKASDHFPGLTTRPLQGLAAKTPSFIDILTNDRLVGFAKAVLEPIAPDIFLNNGELIDIGPGEAAWPMHRDDDAWNFAYASGPLMINTIAAG